MALNIEEEIEARLGAIEAEPHASTPVAEVHREILLVQDMIHTTGTEAAPALRGLSQIELAGLPTPSSTVTRGILRFRRPEDLKPPYYKPEDSTIRLWLDVAHLDHVLYQLQHRKRWLWLGTWPDGYTYGDLHSRP